MLRIYTEHRVDSTIQIKHLDKQKSQLTSEEVNFNKQEDTIRLVRWQELYPGLRSFGQDLKGMLSGK
jgi:hypothetical protein